MNPGSRWTAAGGFRLHVELEGAGPPVVVLHGFTGSGRSMSGVSCMLSASHRTLRIDLPGHGRSDAPRDRNAYSMERCLAQLEAVLAALDVRRAHWLGYSMGGRVALAFAVAHPERVRSALLVGPRAGIADPEARAARVRDDEALASRIEREGVAAFVDAWMEQPLFAGQRRLGAAAWEAARSERLHNCTHGLAGSLRGLGAGAQPPLHARLGNVRIPVALVVGEEDARFRTEAEALAALLPQAEIHAVPDAGHAAHLENPEAFARLARNFLARVERAEREPIRLRSPGPIQPVPCKEGTP